MRRAVAIKFWIEPYRDHHAQIDLFMYRVRNDAGLTTPEGLRWKINRLVDDGVCTHALLVFDDKGELPWMPTVKDGDVVPYMTIEELQRARMAWLCPEGVM